VLGPWRLRWRDDVRELDIPAPALRANDQAVRDEFGDSGDKSIYLTYGATLAEARRNLQAFLEVCARTEPRAAAASLGLVFPTAEDWQALPDRLRALGGFDADLRGALQRHGFAPDSFAPFFTAWDAFRAHPPAGAYGALYALVGKSLSGPLAQLYRPGALVPDHRRAARGAAASARTAHDQPEPAPIAQ
jgi:hypothetical protein